MTDEDALVSAAVAGDARAFARLWELLSPPVAGYLRARGVLDVDDVTSEVFLAAYARLGDFVGGGTAFRRYVFTLAHHKSVDDVRRRYGARVPRQVGLGDDLARQHSPSAEAVALHGELDDQVEQLLGHLPEVQREVLLLRVVAGLGVAEVAEVLGRSSGAVAQLQHRALAALRVRARDGGLSAVTAPVTSAADGTWTP